MSWKASFEPLRVTALLRAGVVSDEYLPLDGILFSQAMRDYFGPRTQSLPGGGVDAKAHLSVSTPLEVRFNADHSLWWYACSFAQPQPWWLAEGQDHWNKRFDQSLVELIDFHGKRGRVIIEQNRYRAYHMPVFYRVAEKIEWYCVGEKKRIAALLNTVTHIGKKGAQGWGRVSEWRVESFSEDWSCWKDGRPMRSLPAGEAMERGPVNLRYYGLHPSYYDKKNQMPVAVP